MVTGKYFAALVLAGLLNALPLAAQSPEQTLPYQPVPEMGIVTEAVVVPPPPPQRPLQRLLNSHGMGCASDFNQLGCGNFWSELTFVFGSCRTFFDQTCAPNPYRVGQGGPETPRQQFGGPDAPRQKCCGN